MAKQYAQEELEIPMQRMEVGDKFITKPGIVTNQLLESFVTLIGLKHPLFLDDEYAQKRGFKSRLSTGVLTFAFMMGLLFQAGVIRDGVYLGTDKEKHSSPVFPGDAITGEIEILNKRLTSKGDNYIITYKFQVRNQEGQVVTEGENTCMFPAG